MLKTVIERCISENSMKSFSSKKGRNLAKNRGTKRKTVYPTKVNGSRKSFRTIFGPKTRKKP